MLKKYWPWAMVTVSSLVGAWALVVCYQGGLTILLGLITAMAIGAGVMISLFGISRRGARRWIGLAILSAIIIMWSAKALLSHIGVIGP